MNLYQFIKDLEDIDMDLPMALGFTQNKAPTEAGLHANVSVVDHEGGTVVAISADLSSKKDDVKVFSGARRTVLLEALRAQMPNHADDPVVVSVTDRTGKAYVRVLDGPGDIQLWNYQPSGKEVFAIVLGELEPQPESVPDGEKVPAAVG